MHRAIIDRAQKCDRCTEYGKNLKVLQGRQHYAELPTLHNPNEEVQIDFAGPLAPDAEIKYKKYLLVAVDRFSKFPSVLVTNAVTTDKVIKMKQMIYYSKRV